MKSLRVLVVVPCYNEQRSVAAVVNDIHWVKTRFGLSLDTLVVNDCSTDNTMAVVRTLDCLHLDLPVNLGIGGCMQAGYKYAYRKGYDIAVQIDGDGQHPAEGLIKLLRPLFDDQADVVIGSRFLERQGFQSS
ncbi:MAG: glycosyltransferase family 2 protein, partial [Sphingobacteriales bacterium]